MCHDPSDSTVHSAQRFNVPWMMVTDSIMVQHAAVLIKEVLFIYIRTNYAFADVLRKECQPKNQSMFDLILNVLLTYLNF